MAMSKKDYQALARAFYERGHGLSLEQRETWVLLRASVVDVLERDNPRFNRALFLEACETGRCKGMKG